VVQVDPLKPKLKPPGSKRLKLSVMYCFQLLLKFNLRRYTMATQISTAARVDLVQPPPPPLVVRRCRLTL